MPALLWVWSPIAPDGYPRVVEQQRRGRRSGKPRCSFCDSDRDDRQWIFGGSKIAICDRCVERCVEEIAAS